MVDGEANMVKMKYDPAAGDGAGEYVLEEIEWEDEVGETHRTTVYPPFDLDLDIDWAETIPELMDEAGHGTTFIMLGRSEAEDTFNGDMERDEDARFLTRKYFNTRFWELPSGVTLRCLEFIKPGIAPPGPAASMRPTSTSTAPSRAHVTSSSTCGVTTHRPSRTRASQLALDHEVHWWLREPDVDRGVGSSAGFIAVLYRKELFGLAWPISTTATPQGANVYRQFGIGIDSVRKRVFIVLEPPEYQEIDDRAGVAPSTGRADLYWMGAGLPPGKPSDWSDSFAERMPDAIQKVLNAAHEVIPCSSTTRNARSGSSGLWTV